MGHPTRYAIVGTGGRAALFVHGIAGLHPERGEIVGLCDPSRVRIGYHSRQLVRLGRAEARAYTPDDFARMLDELEPDCVIVTSVDATHHEYIVPALEAGCSVITEKPMTASVEATQAVLDAAERSAGDVRLTLNYRYMAAMTRFKQLVAEGAAGRPLHVDFQWVLDTSHGADYFRRWHRERDRSGGLLVHKATHHFDLVNWWLDDRPAEVASMASLAFYGSENAKARGETYDYARYTGVDAARDDPFALRLDERKDLTRLYLEAEAETGYLRDRNVFGEGISIDDTMSVQVRYEGGASLSYSLVAYAPWEGFRVAVTGTRGRIELDEVTHAGHLFVGGSQQVAAADAPTAPFEGVQLRVFPMFGAAYEADLGPEAGHAAADLAMLHEIFGGHAPADGLARSASHIDGALAVSIGLAARVAQLERRTVAIPELFDIPRRT